MKELEAERAMSHFNLAGGTALALYLGHRKSVDLDLFTPQPFDVHGLAAWLHDTYGFRTDFAEKNTLKGTIEGIKMLNGAYDWTLIEERLVAMTKEQNRVFKSLPCR